MTKKCDSSENKEIRGASTEAGCDRPACDKQTSGELQSWFKQNFPALYPPNAEQAEIIADHGLNTLVTARAGSGKTTMLIYKVLYLVAHEHVSPDQILLLAFNKNAAVLLRERLFKALVSREEYRYFLEYISAHGIRSGYERDKVLNDALAANRITLPHIMTFHALAYRIVRPAAKSFQMNNDTSSLHRLAFDQALAEDLKDDNAAEDYMKLFREYQADTEKGSGEILYTLDGKAVLDSSDREIGNFLFTLSLEYEYLTDKHTNQGFFRINAGDDKCADIYNYRKLRVGAKPVMSSSLIELGTSDFGPDGSLNTGSAQRLLKKIEKYTGQKPEELTIDEQFSKAGYTRDKIIRIFYGLAVVCRQKKISPDDLASIIRVYKPLFISEKRFNNHFLKIYRSYVEILQGENLYDFPALFSAAEEKLQTDFGNNFFTSRLTHILLDEFQDFSRCYYDLLKVIRDNSKHEIRLTAVGDNWQSINAYAGAQTDFFNDFSSYFTNASRLDMLTNYRSDKKIIEASNAVMHDLGKGAEAYSNKDGAAVLVIPSSVKFQIDPHPETAEIARYLLNTRNDCETVAILTRTQAEAAKYNEEIGKLDLRISTVHSFKGQEADFVIIDVSSWFFPLVHPDSIYSRIAGLTKEKITEEEKRLLYVAMTRARKELYLVAPYDEVKSPFLKDLAFDFKRFSGGSAPWKSGKQSAVTATVGGKTYKIKDDLKKFGFRFDSVKKNWYRKFQDRDQFIQEYKKFYFTGGDVKINLFDDSYQKIQFQQENVKYKP